MKHSGYSIKNQGYNLSLERFVEHYPKGEINIITLNEIPIYALEKFEGYSKRFILPEEYTPKNFDYTFLFENKNSQVYIASQEKVYEKEDSKEKNIYLFEYDSHNTNIGHGEIRFAYKSKDQFFKDKPLVGFSMTEDNFLRQRYGLNRLKMMNALSYMFFNLPLNSSNTITDNAKNTWKKLVANDEAKEYTVTIGKGKKKETIERYVFVK